MKSVCDAALETYHLSSFHLQTSVFDLFIYEYVKLTVTHNYKGRDSLYHQACWWHLRRGWN